MEGRVLAGRYRLLQKLGQGGMGSVWQAQHLELGTQIAVKLMDPSLATHSEGLARFRREAQAAASLQSPNVVNVFDYGLDGDTPYIAMEMLQGENLAQRLARLRRLSLESTATILLQVARAIGKAHDAGIVHRDLKPDNIYLVRDEELEIAKVLDFGIAKRTGNDGQLTGAVQTQTGAMLGTPFYMSPEQAGGKKDVDHRTDIWSFGVIACECVTGRRIFQADTLGGLVLVICTGPMPAPSQIGPASEEFDAWFARCVARDRNDRYQTIREAAAGLAVACRATAPDADLGRLSAVPSAPVPNASPATLDVPQASTPVAGAAPLSRSTQPGPMSLTVGAPKPLVQSKRLPILLGAISFGALVLIGFWFFGRHPHTEGIASASAALATSVPVPTTLAVAIPAASVPKTPILSPVASPPKPSNEPIIVPIPAVTKSVASPTVRQAPQLPTKPIAAPAPPTRAAAASSSSTSPAPKPARRSKRVDLAF